ncbi:MAG TPA: hypothetical protein VIM10_09905 [Actinopolymorphaceae bacterium]|jgi:hypothetical protein
MSSHARIWAVTALLAVLLSSCGLGAHTGARKSAGPSTSPPPSTPGAIAYGTTVDGTTPTSTSSPTPTPTPLAAMVSSDGGPLTATETNNAVARCLGKQASASDIAAVQVEYARDIAYLTDDVLTLPTIILTSKGTRIVCNTDGRVPPRAAGANREPDAEHPAVVVATEGVTGTFNGPFADGMSPFAPCVVLRVSPEVASVVMRLDWPTGDSVWYGAAIENGYAVVSAWMGGTIGAPVDIDLKTVRTQIRAFDATGRELPVS